MQNQSETELLWTLNENRSIRQRRNFILALEWVNGTYGSSRKSTVSTDPYNLVSCVSLSETFVKINALITVYLQVLLKLSGVPARQQLQKGQRRRRRKRKMECSADLSIRFQSFRCLNVVCKEWESFHLDQLYTSMPI